VSLCRGSAGVSGKGGGALEERSPGHAAHSSAIHPAGAGTLWTVIARGLFVGLGVLATILCVFQPSGCCTSAWSFGIGPVGVLEALVR
jgi:hypothetical protein